MKTLLLALLAAIAASPANAGDQQFASPDGRTRVWVVGIGKLGFTDRESRLEIRTWSGRLVRTRSFGSADGQHGFGLRRGAWTPNGRWFVFNVDSSGGHQPWHVPTYVYDTRLRQFFHLDTYVGPVKSDFTMAGNDAVTVTRLNVETGAQDEQIIVRLARITRRAR